MKLTYTESMAATKKHPAVMVIDKRIVNIPPADLIGVILDKRAWQVSFTKLFFNMPLPVGYGAITYPKPNAKNEPAARRNCDAN